MDIETVYHDYYRLIFNRCYQMLQDQDAAEDAAQDVFLHLIPRLHTFRGDSSITTWLHRVTTNCVLMDMRKTSRRPLMEVIEVRENGLTIDPPDPHSPVSDVVMAKLAVEKILSGLPHGMGEALVLHDLEEYTHKDISRMRGKSEGCSKSQTMKARMKAVAICG